MTAKAVVLERFNEPLVMKELEVASLRPGEALIRIMYAGVCGSDVHMWRGRDPRTPLPMILGHEGIGQIARMSGKLLDIFGRELKEGDLVMWERGVMCGQCYYCAVAKTPSLCPRRKTYGISYSCDRSPYFLGCYAEYLHLFPHARLIRIDEKTDPRILVSASCSGATAAHAVELAGVKPGDSVLIVGPGPLGLFALAFCVVSGASSVMAAGTRADATRLELAREFGASRTFFSEDLSPSAKIAEIKDATRGVGANVVIDCTGVARAMVEWLPVTASGGVYSVPGIATPVGEVPLPLFEQIARKNVALQGVWVSDTSHLYRAIELVKTRRFPFEKLVSRTMPLERATEALEAMERREAIKIALEL